MCLKSIEGVKIQEKLRQKMQIVLRKIPIEYILSEKLWARTYITKLADKPGSVCAFTSA